MQKFLRDSRFVAGFFSGLVVFIAMNLYSYARMACTMADGMCGFGLPFQIYETGGFVTITRIIWSGLFANSFIGITGSALLGLLYKQIAPHRSNFK
jgi:hypothetical protein